MSLFPNYLDNKEIVGEFLIIEDQLPPDPDIDIILRNSLSE